MFSLVDFSQMMTHVSNVHGQSFAHAFIRNPAGVPVYYGNYLWHTSPSLTSFVVYPNSLKDAGFVPKGMLDVEIAHDILVCNNRTGPWTDEQRLQILNGPLSWIRGWRFDHLPAGGCGNGGSSAQTILQISPTITWATSNYHYQVQQIPG